MIKNKKFSNAINNIPQSTPPIWFMRQAGRYHSHYQSLRKKHTFVELCKTPSLAAEVAMGPINDFDYDVAILFSDILFPLESLGLKLDYAPGPVFNRFLNENDLSVPISSTEILESNKFQAEALNITRNLLPSNKSLVGFVGGPWTLLSYGLGRKDENKIKDIEKNSFIEKALYDVLIPMLREIIKMQLDNHSEIVYVFDTNAKQLEKDYFVQTYMENLKNKIFSEFEGKIAYFCKDNPLLSNPNNISDYNLSGMVFGKNDGLEKFLPNLNDGFIQGNFEPTHLLKPRDEFEIELDHFIQNFSRLSNRERSGWVCSLNHGVLPKAKEENVKRFINRVRTVFNQLED
ncbi:MAG: uroporphyrinogen decarboxylase family protein [Candidatus Neomarinimicrobiota bacterium]